MGLTGVRNGAKMGATQLTRNARFKRCVDLMPTPLPPLERRRAENIFFTTMAVLMLLIVVAGFAPTYFLKGAVFAHLPSLLVHLHGAVFSSWILLFAVQSSLISAGNYRLHRKLGVLGAVIAGLMVVLGIMATFGTVRRGAVPSPFFTPSSFLVSNVLGMIFFGLFVAVAIWKRTNAPVHKRLMFIANAMLLPPALFRMIFFIPFVRSHMFLIGVIPLGFVVALLLFDLYSWRRPLLVTLIGGVLFWALNPVSDMVMKTHLSQGITRWARGAP